MSDLWVNDRLQTNCVAFDSDAKELVMITNGTCCLDHSSPEAYRASHGATQGCRYKASEAIAVRVLGTMPDASPILGWTYRAVRHEALSPSDISADRFRRMMEGDGNRRRKATRETYTGRV